MQRPPCYGVIYLVTNTINYKKYIGVTISVNPRQRWRRHVSNAKRGCPEPLYQAIRKYGKAAFTFDVIFYCPDHPSFDLAEEVFIKLFDTRSPNGYNLRAGGRATRHIEASRLKMSQSHTGVPWTRAQHEAHREYFDRLRGGTHNWGQNISAAKMGHKVSLATRAKISFTLTGKKQSDETIEKRAAKLRDRPRPPHVTAASVRACKGKPLSADMRLRLSLAARRRLTAAQQADIVARANEPSSRIAKEFGVSLSTISRIRHNARKSNKG